MANILIIVVSLLFISLWVWSNYGGRKCPICNSSRYWSIRYFGRGKDKETIYCKKCRRAVQDSKSKEIVVFDNPQDFN